jgi:hypothetical protein
MPCRGILHPALTVFTNLPDYSTPDLPLQCAALFNGTYTTERSTAREHGNAPCVITIAAAVQLLRLQ